MDFLTFLSSQKPDDSHAQPGFLPAHQQRRNCQHVPHDGTGVQGPQG